MKTMIAAMVAAVVLASASTGYAASCSSIQQVGVTTNTGCQLGSDNNDKLGNPTIQVNIDAIFGIDTWEFLAKDNRPDKGGFNGVDEGANPVDLVLTGSGLKGTWSISDQAFSLYSSLILVLKGPQDMYTAFRLDSKAGDYETVFFKDSKENTKSQGQEISHVSLYGVPATVPVPAAGLLLMGALAALGFARRRKLA